LLVEFGGEGEQVIALVFQETDDGADAVRAKRLAGLQFGDQEIEELATRVG